MLFNPHSLNLSNFTQDDLAASVFMTVDVQNKFASTCEYGTPETEETANKIATMCPVFNDLGLDVAHIIMDPSMGGVLALPTASPFYGINPDDHVCEIVPKMTTSAFRSNFIDRQGNRPIDLYFERTKKKTLFLTGFNLSACVQETAEDAARYGYNVVLVTDLVKNGQGYIERFNRFDRWRALNAIRRAAKKAHQNDVIIGTVTSDALMVRLKPLNL